MSDEDITDAQEAEKPTWADCPYCGDSFDGPRYLSAHIIREHR